MTVCSRFIQENMISCLAFLKNHVDHLNEGATGSTDFYNYFLK